MLKAGDKKYDTFMFENMMQAIDCEFFATSAMARKHQNLAKRFKSLPFKSFPTKIPDYSVENYRTVVKEQISGLYNTLFL